MESHQTIPNSENNKYVRRASLDQWMEREGLTNGTNEQRTIVVLVNNLRNNLKTQGLYNLNWIAAIYEKEKMLQPLSDM